MSNSDFIAPGPDPEHVLPCAFWRNGAQVPGDSPSNRWRGFPEQAARLCVGASGTRASYVLEFEGTIDEVLAAGVAEPGWFPITTKCGTQVRRDRWGTRANVARLADGRVRVRRSLELAKREDDWGSDAVLGRLQLVTQARPRLQLVVDNTRGGRRVPPRPTNDAPTPPEAA
jgi:hypothetical protein